MYLYIHGKKQIIIVTILSFILAAMTIICLVIKEDKITILYKFFYLVFVAFTEELAFRGICVYLLKDFSWNICVDAYFCL